MNRLPSSFSSVIITLYRVLRHSSRGLAGLSCLSLVLLPITGELMLSYQVSQSSNGASVHGLVWPLAVLIWRAVIALAVAGLASEAAPDEPKVSARVLGGVLSGLLAALVAFLAAVPAAVWFSKLGVSLEGASLAGAAFCPAFTAAAAGAVSAFKPGVLAAMVGFAVASLLIVLT